MCTTRASADSQSANLDQHVVVIEYLVARAAKEAALARSMVRHHALEQTAELSPPAWFGLQLHDHLDCHFILSSRRTAPPVIRSRFSANGCHREVRGEKSTTHTRRR
jgi:hypothetical protein